MRTVAVLARPGDAAACPPGVDGKRFRAALLDDVCERIAGLERVQAAVVLSPSGWLPEEDLPVWPGTLVLGVPAGDGATLAALDVLAAIADGAAEAAVIVAGDAPDLPGLLVGKLFRALGSAEIAACPAAHGGLVALGARLPVAGWARETGVGLDTSDALVRLQAAAPVRRAFATGPGWHRLRTPADLRHLDAGLEGWEATRGVLSGP